MTEDVHIDENIKIATEADINSMSKEELGTVNEVKEIYEDMKMISCTSFRYCMPCPFGVDIPRCFKLYNFKKNYANKQSKKIYCFQLGGIASKKAYASLCKDCGKCVPECPQNIDIPKELSTIATEMEGLTMKVDVVVAKGFFSV